MRVVWTEEAQAHLEGIYQYICRDAPLYARRVVDNLPIVPNNCSRIRTPGALCPNMGSCSCANLSFFRIA